MKYRIIKKLLKIFISKNDYLRHAILVWDRFHLRRKKVKVYNQDRHQSHLALHDADCAYNSTNQLTLL